MVFLLYKVLFLLTALLHQISAWPTTSAYANIRSRADQIKSGYDYIIVGGGTSGLTVGDRLSEGGKCMSHPIPSLNSSILQSSLFSLFLLSFYVSAHEFLREFVVKGCGIVNIH